MFESTSISIQIEPDESRPLLDSEFDSPPTPSSSSSVPSSKTWLVLIIISVLALTVDLGFYLTTAPQLEIFQDIICKNYYARADGFDEDRCKSDAVQSELALVSGWLDTFNTLPSVLLSIPYGVLADHWGRKPVILIGMFGFLLGDAWTRVVCFWPNIFSLRLVWLSGLGRAIGGGDQVLSCIALVMLADVVSEDERANVLFYFNAMMIASEVVAIPVSAYLMTTNPWVPYILGFFIEVAGGMLIFLLPETLAIVKQKMQMDCNSRQDRDHGELSTTGKSTVADIVLDRIRDSKESMRSIWRNTNVVLVLLVFFVASISKQSTSLFLQYVSKKMHWSIARASLLITVRGVVTITNFIILMPLVSFIVTKYLHLEATRRDYRLSQQSGLLATLGFFVTAVATTPSVLITGLVMLSVGSAFAVTSRSLATSLVPQDLVGTLYSAASVMQSLGALVAGPLFAYTFKFGMRLGGGWLGLPFLQAGFLFILAVISVSCVRLELSKQAAVEDGNLQEEPQEEAYLGCGSDC